MRHLTLAAALLVATAFAAQAQTAPAGNDMVGPVQVAGQCKKMSGNNHEGAFFYWEACPKAAAAPVHHTARRHHG